jgi:hypothetical protein
MLRDVSIISKASVACVLLSCATEVHADARPAVVELFTSEGCSSCPPAEAYLGELAQRPNVLALAFHVDYWDDLGWRDRFGLPEGVHRQQAYAKTLRLGSVYTPQVIVDGRRDFLGSDRAAINRELIDNRGGVAVTLGVQEGDVRINVSGETGGARSDVVLIAYQRRAVSAIGRGENSGRTLTEFNIVRSIESLGSWDGGTRQYRVSVKGLPGESTDVAVLVQTAGQGPMIGAAARALR